MSKVSGGVYERRVSAEEEREGFLFLTLPAAQLLPAPGKAFPLRTEAGTVDAEVRTVDCCCMGPEKPHRHYRLVTREGRLPLSRGESVRLARAADGMLTFSR